MALGVPPSTKVLLIEEDPKMSNLIARFLGLHGFDVISARREDNVLEAFRQHCPAITIIDVPQPAVGGLGVCRDLSAISSSPILVLSGATDWRSQIQALEAGAADYVVKSAQPRVLLARIRALLRRRVMPPTQPDRLVLGPLTVDRASRSAVWHAGPRVVLTTTEFEILWVLASHAGQVLSREELMRLTRGDSPHLHNGSKTKIDVSVCKLRGKLGEGGLRASCIRTVWGKGYVFVPRGI